MILGTVLVWGAAIVGFGLCLFFPLALLLALAGAADLASEVLRGTLLQLAVPAGPRGRVNALWLAQVSGAPELGHFEAGAGGHHRQSHRLGRFRGRGPHGGALLIGRLSLLLHGVHLQAGTVTVTTDAAVFIPGPREGLPN
ncbi:MAG TPA: hypothetical protein VNF24_00965 [Candidatus Acidoferrales bacterium]|nr:hypothetical protein [Candidatus Acidoferrales bacterium]